MLHIQEQVWNRHTKKIIIFDTDGGSLLMEISGGAAFVYSLWVDFDNRRQGIATRLLDKAEEIAKRNRVSIELEWESVNTSKEILEWYKRKGYKVKETYLKLVKTL